MQERYAYYPGCLASLSQKELDSSTRAVCAKLGVELTDMSDSQYDYLGLKRGDPLKPAAYRY